MKQRLKSVGVTMLVLGLIFASNVQAALVSKTIDLPLDTWVSNKETKISDLQYALTRCVAVYPTSGTDNYQRIKVRLKNSGEVLSTENYYTLVEGASNTKMVYKWYVGEGETVNIQFKGNDPDKTARTDVFYTVN